MPGPSGVPHSRTTHSCPYRLYVDILARIIKVLRQRVDLGLFTIFIKIRAHTGEFLNEKADRWAGEGRDDVDHVRWDGPSLQPTFS